MDMFYVIVGTTAIIILILILLYIGLQMVTKKTASGKNLFPPTYSTCPDFWTVNDGKCKIPQSDGKNIGSLSSANYSNIPGYDSKTGTINFADQGWSATGSAICSQQKWANSNGITWDGVANYNGC